MHPALSIDEIARLICSFLSDTDLISVALTSRPLKEPALGTLWSSMTLEPFLRLFPQDSWETIELLDIVIVKKRELLKEDWKFVMPYTQHIRKLEIDKNTAESSLLNSMALSFYGARLFPKIAEIHFYTVIDPILPFVKLSLSPNITNMTLRTTIVPETHNPDTASMLSGLGLACPRMESFRLLVESRRISGDRGVQFFLDICESLSQSVYSWTRIRKLRVPILNAKALRHISSLPQVVHLEIRSLAELKRFLDLTSFAGFRTLNTLCFEYLDLGTVAGILNAMTTKHLSSIVIASSSGTRQDWEEYFQAVAWRTSASAAVELSTSGTGFDRSNGLMPPDVLRSLFLPPGRNLVQLYIPHCPNIELNDDFIEELTRSSPNLKKLDIGTISASPDIHPMLTLNAYHHAFVHCPNIVHLGLHVDTNPSRAMNTTHDTPLKRHGKDFILSVGNSRVENPQKVAQFLLPFFNEPVLFPGFFQRNDVYLGWRQVSYALTALIQKREMGIDPTE